MKNLKRCMAILLGFAMLLPVLAGCGDSAAQHTHVYGEWLTVKQASCKETGTKTRSCTCGESVSQEIPLAEHVYEQEILQQNTCITTGEITYTCINCGHSFQEATEHTEYTPTELYDLVRASVGAMEIFDQWGESLGVGSCFVYSEDSLITNYHVIEGASWVEVAFGKDTYIVDKVLAYDKNIDIAVLEINAEGLEPLRVCKQAHAVGSTVYAMGNTYGLDSTFTNGMITTAIREIGGIAYVQHNAPISGGNSGGPLFNGYGEVVGINTFTVQDSQNLNFAVAMSELDKLTYGQVTTIDAISATEGDAFAAIAALAQEVGVYDEGSYYAFLLDDTVEINTTPVERKCGLVYDTADETIWIFYELDQLSFALYLQGAADGEYIWVYEEETVAVMGKVVAQTYLVGDPLAGNIMDTDESAPEELQALSGSMLTCMCLDMQEAFASIGLTAADLGFADF